MEFLCYYVIFLALFTASVQQQTKFNVVQLRAGVTYNNSTIARITASIYKYNRTQTALNVTMVFFMDIEESIKVEKYLLWRQKITGNNFKGRSGGISMER